MGGWRQVQGLMTKPHTHYISCAVCVCACHTPSYIVWYVHVCISYNKLITIIIKREGETLPYIIPTLASSKLGVKNKKGGVNCNS